MTLSLSPTTRPARPSRRRVRRLISRVAILAVAMAGMAWASTAMADTISIADVTVDEAAGTASLTVTRTDPGTADATVDFTVAPGTATAGVDYGVATPASPLTVPGAATPTTPTTATITVPIVDDPVDELDETFTVTLSNPVGTILGSPSSATVTITDNDPTPTVSISPAALDAPEGTSTAALTVTLSGASDRDVTVPYSSTNGTATAGSDYAAVNTSLVIPAGSLSGQITLSILDDLLDENDETFTVDLAAPTNAILGTTTSSTVTILDDDAAPTLTIGGVTVLEGSGGGTANAELTVTLSAASGLPVQAAYATADGSAVAPADYAATAAGTVSIPAGDTTATITVPIVSDDTDEIDETFTVSLSAPSNATLGTPSTGTVTIDDDDGPAVSVGDVTVAEGDGSIGVPVTLDVASAQDVSVAYATSDGSATAGVDYTPAASTLTIPAGSTSGTITVPILPDLLHEGPETFTVTISGPVDATVGTASAQVTITDDDAAPLVSVGNRTIAEGTGGTTTATTVTVSIPAISGLPVTVDYATANGSATAGQDYVTATGTATIPAGATSTTIPLSITHDALFEANETFTVAISNPSNATLAPGGDVGTVTISNDDTAPSVSISSSSIAEGANGQTTPAPLTVSLSEVSGLPVDVTYATGGGTATAGTDYVAAGSTVTIPAGQTSAQIPLSILGDDRDENDETFDVSLSAPVNATLGTAVGTVTILDDDPTPSLGIQNVTVTEGSGAPGATVNATLTVTASAASNLPITVDYTLGGGTATPTTDYDPAGGQVSIAPGTTQQTFTVPVVSDEVDEPDETFVATLANAVNATLPAAPTATVTIDDDDGPAISAGNITQVEGTGAGTTTASVPVTLSASSPQTVTVAYQTVPGTAGTDDFTAASGRLTFTPGQTAQNVPITITRDALDEVDEQFTLDLSAPTDATLGTEPATVTIDDDDGPAVSVGDVTVAEGDGTATVTVSIPAASPQPVSVGWTTTNDTAQAPGDYTEGSGTATIAASALSTTFTVPIIDDARDEPDESFTIQLLQPVVDATIGDGIGVVTITDNDPPPTLSINDVAVVEGTGTPGTTDAVLTVSLNTLSGRQVSFGYQTQTGTAAAADFTGTTTGTGTIAAGTSSTTITVPITRDALDEVDETFSVVLNTPVNATILDGTGVVTITDDDDPPTISIANTTVLEGSGAGTTNALVTVSLDAPSGLAVSAAYSTADGTAVAPGDYTAEAAGTVQIPAGSTTGTISVPIARDGVDEANEVFTITLATPTNANLGAPGTEQATVTITDDDGPPTVSIGDVTVTEGTGVGTTAANLTVTLSAASEQTASVGFTTANGTAIAPDDFAATTGTVTFAPGDTVETVTVDVAQDAIDEIDEGFTVTLGAPSNLTVGDGTGAVTIDDDDGPAISVGDVTVVEGTATTGSTTAMIPVTISVASPQAVSASFATADTGSGAVAPGDYTATTGTVAIPAGQTSGTIEVPVAPDAVDENDEPFLVLLSAPVDATIGDGTGTVTITDDDAPPVASVANVSVDPEGNPPGTSTSTVTVSLSGLSSFPVTVRATTADGTALAPDDYASRDQVVTVDPLATEATLEVPIVRDLLNEADETFTVGLSEPSGVTIGTGTATVTIVNDDPLPQLSVDDVSVTEDSGAGATTPATFTVSLNAPSGRTVQVTAATAPGTAVSPDDFAGESTLLTIPAGDTSTTFSVQVAKDALDEETETYTVGLSGASNAIITDASGTGTIVDDDAPPTISVGDLTVPEAGGPAQVPITLSASSGKNVTVTAATADGTAVAPGDYTTANVPLTFTPGQTDKALSVPIVPDELDEIDESFGVGLSLLGNVTAADLSATVTITDDDAPPTVSILDGTVVEGTAGTPTQGGLAVNLSAPSGRELTFAYETANGSATAPGDFAAVSGGLITIPTGDTTATAPIDIAADSQDEVDETLTVTLTPPGSPGVNLGQATLTIEDDDGPTVSVGDVTVDEGTAGAPETATATVSLSASSPQEVSVAYATADGTAVAGDDYTTTGGVVTIPANTGGGTISVPIAHDALDEDPETFEIILSDPVDAVVAADPSGTVTITDNDDPPVASIVAGTVIEETNAGTTQASLTVNLSGPSGRPVELTGSTGTSGSATAGVDFLGLADEPLTIPAGQTQATATVSVVPDATDEVDETVPVSLSVVAAPDPTATIGAGASADLTIDDDDGPTISVTVDPATVVEGTGSTNTTTTATISLSQASVQTVSVDYSTTGSGSTPAVAPGDFVNATGTLTFAPGDPLEQTVPLSIVADALDDQTLETFVIALSAPVDGILAQGASSAEVSIQDDDAPTTVSVGATTIAEGTGAPGTTTTVNVPITLAAPSGQNVVVNASTVAGTAVPSTPSVVRDYTNVPPTQIIIPAGETTRNLPVTVVSDNIDELDESFIVQLAPNPANAILGASQGTVTITDDDTATLAITPALVTRTEGTGVAGPPANFTIQLSTPSDRTVTVAANTISQSATAGQDFTAVGGTLTFVAGQTVQSISLDVVPDAVDEPNETALVRLSSSTNAAIAAGDATLQILDDDAPPPPAPAPTPPPPAPVLPSGTARPPTAGAQGTPVAVTPTARILDTAVFEGNRRRGNVLRFPVVLSQPAPRTLRIPWSVRQGSARSRRDYTTTRGRLTIRAGQTTGTIVVQLVGDLTTERDELLRVVLSNAPGLRIADRIGVGRVLDDDRRAVRVALGGCQVVEGSRRTRCTFPVLVSRAPQSPIRVTYSTANGSARTPRDYLRRSGAVNVRTVRGARIPVVVVGDRAPEDVELFSLRIATRDAQVAGRAGQGVILDDDR